MGQTCGAEHCGHAAQALLPGASGSACVPRAAPRAARWAGAHEESRRDVRLLLRADHFQTSVVHDGDAHGAARSSRCGGWKEAYALGHQLGDGISAKVFQAEAPAGEFSGQSGSFEPGLFENSCRGAVGQCLRDRGRRVAVKRFHRVGSRTYQKELAALQQAGVHPNVLRLLESHKGCDGEDVLVLEYCDGSTLYDLYASEHPRGGVPHRLVARLLRQLLLALEHLAACGIEHQDVKPENMMLYSVSVSSAQGELKLGDFGWAALANGRASGPPATGAGSLWYAPPELNPPVAGCAPPAAAATDAQGRRACGQCDMWSVGVVAYLLLVGHNPFNLALRQPTQDAIDAEVIRLAALGQFNSRAENWRSLRPEARQLVEQLLQVPPRSRPPASDALRSAFLAGGAAFGDPPTYGEEHAGCPSGPAESPSARWARLDGLQRLAWLAVARAVAEPELERSVVSAALEGAPDAAGDAAGAEVLGEASYLWQLARQLAARPVLHWLRDRGAWADIERLAFSYLDVDSDGVLSAEDLAAHTAGVRQGASGAAPGEHDSCDGAAAVPLFDAWRVGARAPGGEDNLQPLSA
ncbi:unnamed protein product, partial [Prorocentrum cordatum]